ncbi:MAG: hypothetical protein ACYC5Y_07175 [Symbiobacteriia bacterium]
MFLVIGSYQISVQRQQINEQLRVQKEVRRLHLERQVEAERRQSLVQLQQINAQVR